jgi:hypothetical protein
LLGQIGVEHLGHSEDKLLGFQPGLGVIERPRFAVSQSIGLDRVHSV